MAWLTANPPEDGRSVELSLSGDHLMWRFVGDASWFDLVDLDMFTGPAGPPGVGAKGDKGDAGAAGTNGKQIEVRSNGTALQWRYVGETWADIVALTALKGADGAAGAAGAAGATLMGTVVIGQTAAVAISLGIREVTAAMAGVVRGGRYIAFCDSYRLNGGSSVVGRPTGYTMLDCVCNTDGQITVSVNAPLLAIGASYALTCAIVRINA